MAIRNWHKGKLIILWAWGGVLSAVLLTNFMKGDPGASPAWHTLFLLPPLVFLVVLSAITWHWLGGKESR